MPLNRETGEIIGDLGTSYYIAPFARWVDTPLFGEACSQAADAFISAGALLPVDFREPDVLIQEYPDTNRVAFVFQRKIGGREHFYPYIFALPHPMVQSLRLTGRWGRPH